MQLKELDHLFNIAQEYKHNEPLCKHVLSNFIHLYLTVGQKNDKRREEICHSCALFFSETTTTQQRCNITKVSVGDKTFDLRGNKLPSDQLPFLNFISRKEVNTVDHVRIIRCKSCSVYHVFPDTTASGVVEQKQLVTVKEQQPDTPAPVNKKRKINQIAQSPTTTTSQPQQKKQKSNAEQKSKSDQTKTSTPAIDTDPAAVVVSASETKQNKKKAPAKKSKSSKKKKANTTALDKLYSDMGI